MIIPSHNMHAVVQRKEIASDGSYNAVVKRQSLFAYLQHFAELVSGAVKSAAMNALPQESSPNSLYKKHLSLRSTQPHFSLPLSNSGVV